MSFPGQRHEGRLQPHREIRLRTGPHDLRFAGGDVSIGPLQPRRHGLPFSHQHGQSIRELPAGAGLRAPPSRRRRRSGSRAGGRTPSIVQDDYKPMRNLTINLGVRWSYESPFQTAGGKQSQFDPNVDRSADGPEGRDRAQRRRARQKGPEQFPAAHRRGLQLQAEMGVPRQLRDDHGGPADLHAEQQLRRVPGDRQPPGASRAIRGPSSALSQGPPPFKFNVEPGRLRAVHRNQLQRPERDLVRSQHADALYA